MCKEKAMSKSCKYCGKDMPDEANICLNCFSLYNEEENLFLPTMKKATNKTYKKQAVAVISTIACAAIILPFALTLLLGSDATPVTADNNGAAPAEITTSTKVETFIRDTLNINTKKEESKQTKESNSNLVSSQKAENKASEKSSSPSSDSVSSKTTTKKKNSKKNSKTEATASSTSSHNAATRSTTASTTSAHGTPNTTKSTAKATTAPYSTTKKNENSTKPATTEAQTPVLNLNDYEYIVVDKGVEITKYKGKSNNIIIPDRIDGKNVVKIQQKAFDSNTTLQYVTFKDSEKYHTLWVNSKAFYNCTALKEITFPKNTDLGILSMFADGCTSMVNIKIDNSQYKFDKGALYYNNGRWYIYYYCEGYNAENYTIPEFVQGVSCENAMGNNKYLKKIYLNDRFVYPIQISRGFYNLEGVYAPDDSLYLYDINGVLFKKGSKEDTLLFYPSKNSQKTFTAPDNCYFDIKSKNSMLETLIIPENTRFNKMDIEEISTYFTNLKTIKISKKNPQLQVFKDNFTGTIITY